jgi:hypothetical protein
VRRPTAFLLGVLAGVAACVGSVVVATETTKPPKYAMVTAFQPDPAWTREQAAEGIRKLEGDYDARRLKGFESKRFLGAFDRNEFGGFYVFTTREDMEAFLKVYPPAPNRSMKLYEILDTWKPKSTPTPAVPEPPSE